MRAHCKSQHNYDPLPTENTKKYGFSEDTEVDSGNLESSNYYEAENAISRVVTMLKNFSKIQELNKYGNAGKFRSGTSQLNSLVDDYVIVNKGEISGISGYLCNRCLSFQFQYVMDIGHNLTAREKHRCDPEVVKISNTLQNRIQRYDELVTKATDCLVTLTNSIFQGKVDVVLISDSSRFVNYHAALLGIDHINPRTWLWELIHKGKLRLSDTGLRNYIARMKLTGTYAKIHIKDGPYSGYYMMYLKRREFNLAKLN